ncbi:MAG TPA: Cof-type HAD-IIB family hydrolase [Ktedonobacteraceae bacterium]|jgi:Cof subfamily protein (haloacid dehalogenase superfamily)|nr:Cof-type HAD-IIB family hydrolase [Ktedonobacteraceae bacterium]
MEQQSPSIRLIVIDIDGTLLNPEQEITPRTRAAIKAAQDAGIVVTLATGRRYYSARPVAEDLGLEIPLILCDGGMIVQHPAGDLLQAQLLSADIGQQAVDIMRRYHIQPVSQSIRGKYEETRTGPQEYDSEWVINYFASFPYELIRLPYTELCSSQSDLLRIVAFTSLELAEEMSLEIAELPCSWNVTHLGSYQSAELVVMPPNCTKASGVKALADRLAIPMEQVMAIGDNSNDIEMIQEVGWGVAMGQALPRLKEVAHAHTASNAEDGVALAIERYALLSERTSASNSFSRSTCL